MATVNDGAVEFFSQDHRECDEAWAVLEEKAGAGDAAATKAAFKTFLARMTRHLSMEEEVLFPAVEDATGMHGGGPTMVMRMEHTQMRAMFEDMAARLDSGDLQGLLDVGDTLLMMIQQHNAKEEGMLYPMADAQLSDSWSGVAAKLKSYVG